MHQPPPAPKSTPRQIKRLRQHQAQQPDKPVFPEREVPIWKPLG